jgi:hypothetical protein
MTEQAGQLMSNYDVCNGTAVDLHDADLCLYELSKDADGKMSQPRVRVHDCRQDECKTLATDQTLDLTLSSHSCDSGLGALFDGSLHSPDLTTVFVDADGTRRGMHAATFTWPSSAGMVVGELSGMTNEGTHRKPHFRDCQQCDETGVMEGRLCGRLERPAQSRLAGLQVFAAYRLRFRSTREGAVGGVTGTLEGLVVRNCRSIPRCTAFPNVGDEPNPRVVGDVSIETFGATGPTPVTSVVTWAGHTGLHMHLSSRLTFITAVSQVTVTLVHFAVPATATAFDAGGAVLATRTMTAPQGVPETLPLSGPGIAAVVVDSPMADVMLQEVCRTL